MSRVVRYCLALCLLTAPLEAQDLRTQLRNLFQFGSGCGDLICLSTSAGNHASHFNPDEHAVAETIVNFLTNAFLTTVSSIPIGATSSGTTFRLDPTGVPIATSGSTGPIFGERSQTLGRSRFLVGANVTGNSFSSIRGVNMGDIRLTLTHQDTPPTGLGNPTFEYDRINVKTSMSASLTAFSAFVMYGVTNRLDIGLTIPVVHLSFSGTSVGTIVPHDFATAGCSEHFWAGTACNPVLVDTARSSGSKTGIGDVTARAKFNMLQTESGGAALLADVHLPTGKQADLLGAGTTSVRGLLVASTRVGQLTPHVNAGYFWRGGTNQNSDLLGTVGFDALVTQAVTLAADFIGQWQVGANKISMPSPVQYIDGSTADRTNIPDQKDNVYGASFGGKFSLQQSLTAVGNVIFPLGNGGMRSNATWTFGLEKNF
jgi:hypothetical protein